MLSIKNIIWDWNGTLLDDIDICVGSINELLRARDHSVLDKFRYKDIFTFPVKDYYIEAGFSFRKESFDIVAMEFIEQYRENLCRCDVFPEARKVLNWFAQEGYTQFMISAMEHRFLLESVKESGIMKYFTDISGIHDHFANGKTQMAKDFCVERNIEPSITLFIGDTLHDFEVARALGMKCILVANGHQSEERLAASGCEVVSQLTDLIDKFKNGS